MPTKGARCRAANKLPVTPPKVAVTQTTIKQPAVEPESELVANPGSFYLVQRAEPKLHPSGDGIDKYFLFDYMGSVDFEGGKIAACVRKMRETGDLVIQTAKMRYMGQTKEVFLIGPAADMAQKIVDMQAWLDSNLHGKEWTNFDTLFTGNYSWQNPEFVRSRAWLSLTNRVFFTLSARYAKLILKGLNKQ